MAELLSSPRAALADVARPGRHGRPDGSPGLILSERAELSLATVIARKGESRALAELVRSAYGIDLPPTPRFAGGQLPDGRFLIFIWAGFEQWLALAEGAQDFERELTLGLGKRAMITDQSDGRAILRLRGAKAREVLAKGIAIDLHPRAFKTGDAALTMATHIAVQLWQVDETPTYEIAVARSFAKSLWDWLSASAAEFGYEVA
ncbi:MAG: sarcosine oxidase subunit gamma [Hyphomicrobiales bacterium]|nr:sarcosine oxidase subunit gamma [Hyphomicrobiales bacterium]